MDQIVAIALKDGVVDENEKRVLRSIFAKLNPGDLTPEMLGRIARIRQQANM